jgi:soluble lytic murein transglycosylase
MAKTLKLKKFRGEDLFDPQINVKLGTYYFSRLVTKYSDHIPLALAAYNAGPGRLDRWLRGHEKLKPSLYETKDPMNELWMEELPWKETQLYIRRIMRNWLFYNALYTPGFQLGEPIWGGAVRKSRD